MQINDLADYLRDEAASLVTAALRLWNSHEALRAFRASIRYEHVSVTITAP